MENLLYTFQVSPDWIKALWIIMPPAFALGLPFCLSYLWRLLKRTDSEGELIYSVRRDQEGEIRVYWHGKQQIANAPAPLLLPNPQKQDATQK